MNLKKIDRNLYDRIHRLIKKSLPKPLVCNRCQEEKVLELSNNSRLYIPDVSDWEWICHSCHAIKDRWSKGRILTVEHKRKIGEANKIALLGHIPWNKGQKTNSVLVHCEYCKKEFYVVKWKHDRGRGRFCSLICRKGFYIKS